MAGCEVKARIVFVIDEESAADARAKLRAIADETFATFVESAGGLAPYYRADGSIAMLPAAEVERRRRAAARVIRAARDVIDPPPGRDELYRALAIALEDLGPEP